MVRTKEEVKAIFRECGIPIAEWADNKGFSRVQVYGVLNSKKIPVRGERYQIAVELGLVASKATSLEEFNKLLKK